MPDHATSWSRASTRRIEHATATTPGESNRDYRRPIDRVRERRIRAALVRTPSWSAQSDGDGARAANETPVERNLWIGGAFVEAPVYTRTRRLTAAARIAGPAVVEAYDSTTYVAPEWRSAVDGRTSRCWSEVSAVTDPITVEVIKSALVYAAEEMGIAVRNAAYSPNIKERLDHSCALFDRFGRLIAQAEHIPVHLGSLPWGLAPHARRSSNASTAARAKASMWVANDPYVAGTHLNDVTLVRPVFHDGALVGYAANKAHHADVGGSVPGSMPADAAEIFAEGFVVPRRCASCATTAYSTRSSRSFARTRARPTRAAATCARKSPATTRANGACAKLCDRYGVETFEAAIDADTRRQRARDARRAPRARRRRFERRGFSRRRRRRAAHPHRTCARAARRRRAMLDYTGTSAQVAFPLNAVFGVTLSGVHYALARRHRSDDPDERGLLSSGRRLRARGIAAQSAPAGAGLGRQRRDVACAMPTSYCKRSRRRRRSACPRSSGGTMSNVMLGGTRADGTHVGFLRDERLRDGRAAVARRDRRDSLSHDQHAQHADRSDRTRVPAARRCATRSPRERAARDATAAATVYSRDRARRRNRTRDAARRPSHARSRPARKAEHPGAVGRHALRRDGAETTAAGKDELSDFEPGDVLTIQTPGRRRRSCHEWLSPRVSALRNRKVPR